MQDRIIGYLLGALDDASTRNRELALELLTKLKRPEVNEALLGQLAKSKGVKKAAKRKAARKRR